MTMTSMKPVVVARIEKYMKVNIFNVFAGMGFRRIKSSGGCSGRPTEAASK